MGRWRCVDGSLVWPPPDDPLAGLLNESLSESPLASKARRRVAFKRAVVGLCGRCFHCGCVVSVVGSNIDHFVARSVGGDLGRGNWVVSCYGCNSGKGHGLVLLEDCVLARECL